MEPLISVIVPIYNVKAYLDTVWKVCWARAIRDLEIFLVDDGSTDGCGKVCDRYAAQDPRITVIHKKNGGLSDARNAALDAAQYYAFVDGDDWVSPYYVENLYRALRKADADMAVSCFEEVFEAQGHPVAARGRSGKFPEPDLGSVPQADALSGRRGDLDPDETL